MVEGAESNGKRLLTCSFLRYNQLLEFGELSLFFFEILFRMRQLRVQVAGARIPNLLSISELLLNLLQALLVGCRHKSKVFGIDRVTDIEELLFYFISNRLGQTALDDTQAEDLALTVVIASSKETLQCSQGERYVYVEDVDAFVTDAVFDDDSILA